MDPAGIEWTEPIFGLKLFGSTPGAAGRDRARDRYITYRDEQRIRLHARRPGAEYGVPRRVVNQLTVTCI